MISTHHYAGVWSEHQRLDSTVQLDFAGLRCDYIYRGGGEDGALQLERKPPRMRFYRLIYVAMKCAEKSSGSWVATGWCAIYLCTTCLGLRGALPKLRARCEGPTSSSRLFLADQLVPNQSATEG